MKNRLWDWLLDYPDTKAKLAKFIALMIGIDIAWLYLVIRPVTIGLIGLGVTPFGGSLFTDSLFLDLLLFPFAALAEELMRILPIMVVMDFVAKHPENSRRSSIFRACVITAILFGAAHVINGLPLWFAIANQGMSGFIYNMTFLKAGGLHDRPVRGILASSTVHFLFNMTISFIFACFGPPI